MCLGACKKLCSRIVIDDQPLVHLTSGKTALKSMVIEFKTAKKRGEDARKEFFSRFTRVNSVVTTKSTYYDSTKQPCTIFAPKKSAKKELVIPTDKGQSLAEILSKFSGKTLELKRVMHGCVAEKPWSVVKGNDKTRSTAKSTIRNLLQQNSTLRP